MTVSVDGRLLRNPTSQTCLLDMGISKAEEFFQWARQEFNHSRGLGNWASDTVMLQHFSIWAGLPQPLACRVSLMKVTLGIPVFLSHLPQPVGGFIAAWEANVHSYIQYC